MATKQAWEKLKKETEVLRGIPASHWTQIDNWALRLLPLIRQQFSSYEQEFLEQSKAPEIYFISAGMEDAEFQARYNMRCDDQKERLLNLLQGIIEHNAPPIDEVEEKLREFRQRFANAIAFPWDDIAVIAEEARPFIERYLPDHLERFNNSTKGPNFTYSKPLRAFKDPDHPEAVASRQRQEGEHAELCAKEKRLLVGYLDGLISAGAHKQSEPTQTESENGDSKEPQTMGEIVGKLKDMRSTLRRTKAYPWDSHVGEWTQKAIPFFMAHLPDYLPDFRRVTTPPNPTKIPMPAAVLAAGPGSSQYRDIESRQEQADRQNYEAQRGQIISFLSGLIDLGDRLEQPRTVVIQQHTNIVGDNIVGSTSGEANPGPAPAQAKGPPIFISHASADETLVNGFADLLQLTCGLQQKDIFCTSIEGMDIPNGLNFVDVIRKQLVGSKVVIFILSRAYFDSQFCLTELGATWALATRPFFLIVPPIDYRDLKGVLQNLQATKINDAAKLTLFWEELQKILGITGNSAARWEIKRDEFLGTAKKFIDNQPTPVKITLEEFNAVQAQRDDAMNQLKGSFTETERVTAELERVKQLKDRVEVAAVEKELQPNNEVEEFGAVIDGIRNALAKLPEVTKGVMFRKFSKGPCFASDFESQDVRDEVDSKFIIRSNNLLSLNEQDPSVKAALSELEQMQAFLNRVSPEKKEIITLSLGFIPELDNRRFWDVLDKGLSPPWANR